jgi:hypothetical protein
MCVCVVTDIRCSELLPARNIRLSLHYLYTSIFQTFAGDLLFITNMISAKAVEVRL